MDTRSATSLLLRDRLWCGYPVQPQRVEAEQLRARLVRHVAGVLAQLGDDAGILRVAVREVRCPDHVVGADEARQRAHRALAGIERHESLTEKIFARFEAQVAQLPAV